MNQAGTSNAGQLDGLDMLMAFDDLADPVFRSTCGSNPSCRVFEMSIAHLAMSPGKVSPDATISGDARCMACAIA